jgi:hypothetical protein
MFYVVLATKVKENSIEQKGAESDVSEERVYTD